MTSPPVEDLWAAGLLLGEAAVEAKAWQGGLGQQWQDLADAVLPCSALPQTEAARPSAASVALCVHRDAPACGLSPAAGHCFAALKQKLMSTWTSLEAEAAVLQALILHMSAGMSIIQKMTDQAMPWCL